MLKTPHLTRSRATFARLYQSVDRSTCCGKPIALPRRTAASAARAIAHHCCGVVAPPFDAMADCTSRTTATGFAPRHELQQRCAGRQLPGSSGDPPWETGTASSTTPWHGCRLGSDVSIGSPQIQHGSPLPRTRALNASRRWPLARRGFGLLDAMPPSIGRAPGHPAPPLPSPPRGRGAPRRDCRPQIQKRPTTHATPWGSVPLKFHDCIFSRFYAQCHARLRTTAQLFRYASAMPSPSTTRLMP